jgi:hypothetical protein
LSKTMKVLCEIQPEQPRQSEEAVEEQQENLNAREKMEHVEECAKGNREQLQDKLKLSAESENAQHAELSMTNANTLRLERQRSIVDVTRLLTKQVNRGIEDATKLRKQSIDDQKIFKDEVRQLKNELASFKQNQANASRESLVKRTEHLKEKRKLQKDISRFNHEFKSMRDKFANQEGKIVDLEIKLQQSSQTNRELGFVQDALKISKANEESFLADLKQKNKLLREAERALTSVPSDEEMGDFLDEIKMLKKQINELKAEKTFESDEHKAMEQKYREEICKIKATLIESDSDEHKAMEQAYREEICNIKATLIESEMRCQKEASRYEKERRTTFDSDEHKAMEQAYREEICKIKATLIESQMHCQKEASRSEKERRTIREMEVERVKESERLRLVTEQLSEVESRLQAENTELKQKLDELSRVKSLPIAQPWSEGTVRNAPRSPSTTNGEKGMHGPATKADSLRKKLAQSRERLADIRDASRPLPPQFFSLDQWISLKGSPWYKLALFQSKGEPQTPTPSGSVTSNESLSSASLYEDDQFSSDTRDQPAHQPSDLEIQLGSMEEEYVVDCAPALITTVRVHVGEEYQMSSGICTISEVFMGNALDGIEVTERKYADI